MRQRWWKFLAFAVVIVLACGIIYSLVGTKSRQPAYRGLPLDVWLKRYAEGDASAELALRAIGTNAVPYLIEMLRSEDPKIKKGLYWLMHGVELEDIDLDSALQRQMLACAGLEALGPLGEAGIPHLAELLSETNLISGSAARALAAMGPEGIDLLGASLTNSNIEIRASILAGLGNARSDHSRAAMILTNALNSTNATVRWAATRSLAALASHTTIGLEPVLSATDDPNRAVRIAAFEALGEFGSSANYALPVVREATNNVDPLIRRAASSSLRRIAGDRNTNSQRSKAGDRNPQERAVDRPTQRGHRHEVNR